MSPIKSSDRHASTYSPMPAFETGFTLALRQFFTNRAATAGLFCFLIVCIAAILAPVIAPFDPTRIQLGVKLEPPSFHFLLGTDHFGRDMLSRLIWGARVSLLVGIGVTAFALLFGVPIGLLAGYVGGRTDNALMRLMDGFLTFPPLLLGVAVVGLLGPDLQNVMIALGVVQVPVLARIVRGATLSVSKETYVTATRALGASTGRVILCHILRNILSAIVVQMTICFSAAIITEASLSFLGIGTQPPMPSWGRDLAEARRFIADAPWLFLAPTAAITLCVVSINFIGDGLRDSLDPKSWRARRAIVMKKAQP
ncbi:MULTISPECIES: ABC transporter permease [unclassified Phyllobacterium]|uniref:ABC transporter permease n=1 Tax=unclassified Phyllobacterium TaxID=2638441 RepID=UPI0030131545